MSDDRRVRHFTRADNHQFTYEYSQPDEYRFCQDSVIFPMLVRELLIDVQIGPDYRALDICAGCGVIGFELAHYESRLVHVDFMDVQEIFRPHFEANLKIAGRDRRFFHWLPESFTSLSENRFTGAYDLIVGNPPYFAQGEGRLSKSDVQNSCRFFLNGDLRALVDGVVNALKPGTGRAYLLVKSGAHHGRRASRDLSLWLAGRAVANVIADVRGTDVVEIQRG